MQLTAIENANIYRYTKIFNETSTANVRSHNETCDQDRLDAMTAIK